MPYSEFTLARVKRDFGLTTVENGRFLPETQLVEPSVYLKEALTEGLPLAIATGSEKARSELIISPILVEVRKILQRKVSLFSGEDFTVAPELGLSGVCEFIISRSPEHQERIFRVFERLHGSDTYPGTGIGLAIVRKGVELMGGQVGIISQIGHGSRFWVELLQANN